MHTDARPPRVSEAQFHARVRARLQECPGAKSVSGPGRSGAVAAVYASHILRVPFIPYGQRVPEALQPHLVIDTATMTGRTLRKAARKMGAHYTLAVYHTDRRHRFWYEEGEP